MIPHGPQVPVQIPSSTSLGPSTLIAGLNEKEAQTVLAYDSGMPVCTFPFFMGTEATDFFPTLARRRADIFAV